MSCPAGAGGGELTDVGSNKWPVLVELGVTDSPQPLSSLDLPPRFPARWADSDSYLRLHMKFLLPSALAFATALAAQTPEPQPAPARPQPAPMPTPAPQPSPARPPEGASKVEALTNRPRPVAGSPVTTVVKKKTVAEVIKNSDTLDGLFRLHRDRETGAVHLYVRKEQLDREFIYFSHTVDGVVSAGRNRGQFGDETVFMIHRNYEKLEFIEQNTAFYFDPEHPLARAAKANVSHAVLATEPIVAQDAGGFLLSAGGLFLKETLRQVKPGGSADGKSVLGKLSETKTKFVRMKSFPRNTLVTVEYVFENPTPPSRSDDEKEAPDLQALPCVPGSTACPG